MRDKLLLFVLLSVLLGLLPGCGGSESKWKAYVGTWVRNNSVSTQIEVKPNGESFIVTQYSGLAGQVMKQDFIAKPQGEVLVVTFLGSDIPIIHSKSEDELSFEGGKYHRQKPEEGQKLEDMKKKVK